jgi:hypothetical protein
MNILNSRFFNVGQLRMIALAAACLALAAEPVSAGDAVRYRASPVGCKVRIDGSSNIHDWVMDGQLISGFFELPAGVVLDQAQAAPAGVSGGKIDAHAEAFIPVTSVKSGTTGMDEVMQQAMNATDFPRIQYRLTEMVLKEPHVAGTPFQFDTKGELMVAGVTNKVDMPIRIESVDASKLKVIGSVPLKMTDFKIKPPVKMGVFKTVDDIKISFEWMVSAPKKAAEAKAQ